MRNLLVSIRGAPPDGELSPGRREKQITVGSGAMLGVRVRRGLSATVAPWRRGLGKRPALFPLADFLSMAENCGKLAPIFFSEEAMAAVPDHRVTELLRAAQAGDASAAAQLLELVYAQLHELARARMAHLPPGQTLQPTALVHEAYLRLAGKQEMNWESRQHFFFAVARAMRDILVEQARRKAGPAHGGGRRRQELDEACVVLAAPTDDVLAVHEAL